MTTTILRTTSTDFDFKKLVKQLDKELAISDGEDHAFYDQFNQLDSIKFTVVAYLNGVPVGCGAIKHFSEKSMEVKRMFVLLSQRGKGIASQMLNNLEAWAKELGAENCILETGIHQPEAISLYKKCGYIITENYGQYAGIETSICFKKLL